MSFTRVAAKIHPTRGLDVASIFAVAFRCNGILTPPDKANIRPATEFQPDPRAWRVWNGWLITGAAGVSPASSYQFTQQLVEPVNTG
jgi:hypothetical protein